MKFRTNRERAARKERKAMEIKDSKKKQLRISYHARAGYHTIISAVKEKSSLIIIRNAHPGRKIEKKILFPKMLWARGTYIRKEHGPLTKESNRYRVNAAFMN